jgi:hypothetical protein
MFVGVFFNEGYKFYFNAFKIRVLYKDINYISNKIFK